MKKIDFYCGEPHFFDHISPIWLALDKEYRGTFYISEGRAQHKAQQLGIEYEPTIPQTDNLCLVASIGDYRRTKGPVVFMEHGIGNTYSNRHAGYAGGVGRERVVLFLNQHRFTDEKNFEAYPHTAHAIIGTPKLDKVPKMQVRKHGKPIVCISFHWDCHIARETRSTLPYYRKVIPQLERDSRFQLIGHAHPGGTWQQTVKMQFHKDTPFYDDFAEVQKLADIYIIDNSSSMYEFAYTGKPVIALNMPTYRINVHHGIRFWDYIPGPLVWRAQDLLPMILRTIDNPDEFKPQRDEAIEALYPYQGVATQRAVSVIKDFLKAQK